ncbi:glycosyltransferase family A protein [Echinicola jeungdonensis]|uniref:Glycosyltransferase n=1 Tax=Echinicola jeungdonensis TaxID=709343 RepID=A0ABV5J664_9BACT|nr:glycosyltransferase family A protein [Echinicola jeungdonensis]MDN3667871.1 glycosyltransferase family A protein [Echinicola jeungdonensis]
MNTSFIKKINRLIISVIIPYYKDYDRLILLLEKLQEQELDSDLYEVIIVNNDPEIQLKLPDNFNAKYSLKLVDEFTPGSYAARNKGITESKGKILAFTDSDCLPDSSWLSNALKIFSKDTNKEIGILTGPVPLFYKRPDKLTFAEVYEKYTGFSTEAYAKEGHAITANWFSYCSVIQEFNGFNRGIKSNGDSELSKKITTKYEIKFTPNVIVRHPSRHLVKEIVYKYRRLLGGTYERKFRNSRIKFFIFLLNFTWRRFRFSTKKIVTVNPFESTQILVVNLSIIWGTWKEFFLLLKGEESKR